MTAGKFKIVNGKIVSSETGEAIPDEEPVFILRAKDRKSLEALGRYYDICINETHKQGVLNRMLEFQEWRENNQDLLSEPSSLL